MGDVFAVWATLRRYRELIAVTGLLCLGLGTYVAHVREPRELSSLDRLCLAASAPIARGIDFVVGSGLEVVAGFYGLLQVRDNNERLIQENLLLKAAIAEGREARAENARLQALLPVRAPEGGSIVASRVVGVSPTHRRSVTLAVGEGDGVRAGQPVVTGDGVVGRVTATWPGYAEVQLLVDPGFAAAVRVQRSRARATVRGLAEDARLRLDHALRTDDVEDGDLLVTAGTDGVFPRGLVVGRAQAVTRLSHGMYLTAEVRPAVDVTKLEEVLVLVTPPGFALPVASDVAAPPAAAPGAP